MKQYPFSVLALSAMTIPAVSDAPGTGRFHADPATVTLSLPSGIYMVKTPSVRSKVIL